MNRIVRILSKILGIVAFFILSAAIVLSIRQIAVSLRTNADLETMRESAEAALSDTDREDSAARPDSETLSPSGTSPDETIATGSLSAEPTPVPSPEPTPVPLRDNPYRDSFLANSDMVAWLKIEGTVIDYPVMWTPEDETYYLYRNFNKANDKTGCLILDTDSALEPLTTNLIIHGHNMRSGAMFGNLTKYESKDYFEEHRYLKLYTESVERNYEVIAVFRSQVFRVTDSVFKYYKFFQADTPEEFDDFYQNIMAMSLYDTGVTAQFGDHFITLSTCVYHVENGRFVVVAKEIEPGDYYAPFREPVTAD